MKKPQEIASQVKNFVKANKTDKALELLSKEQLSSIDKELILLNSRYAKINQEQIYGTIDDDEYRQEINKIHKSLLDITDVITGKISPNELASAKQKKTKRLKPLHIIVAALLLIGAVSVFMLYGSGKENPTAKDDEEFEQMRNVHTVEAYESYLYNFPYGKHRREAEDHLTWLKTSSADTEQAYSDYLRDFKRDGKYVPEAENKLKQFTASGSTISTNDSEPKPEAENKPPTIKTIFLEGKEWMTENLNVDVGSNICWDDNEANCREQGRLYRWDSAKRACQSLGDGWRLPTKDDWLGLTRTYGTAYGDKFKDHSAYNDYEKEAGLEAYKNLIEKGRTGFDGTKGGKSVYLNDNFVYFDFGDIGHYWVDEVDPNDSQNAKVITFREIDKRLLYEGLNKTDYVSCRCVRE